jgi:hypothetical protein
MFGELKKIPRVSPLAINYLADNSSMQASITAISMHFASMVA